MAIRHIINTNQHASTSRNYGVFLSHNPKVIGSNPIPATKIYKASKATVFEAFVVFKACVGAM
jgi:hypothetical protein